MRKTVVRKRRSPHHTGDSRWMMGAMIAALALVGALLLLNLIAGAPSAAPVVSNGRVWGQDGAPVSIEIFSDFQ
ncbi:MAG: hypothetical protein HYR71_09610 [Chloroflexi bacterium]|nr:hypothetical protein [Chloroflexota bacterium]